jgi:hypothetical protein
MWGRGPRHTVDRSIDRSEERTMKKSFAITLAAAALILVVAFATLAVLTAVAGQESGLEKSTAWHCAKPAPAVPTARARCTASWHR